MNKDLDYFLSLPYSIVLYPADEGGYVVQMPDLPGCLSQAESLPEALEMIKDAQAAWLETALGNGLVIPEPGQDKETYSGKFNLRVPKSLHRLLSEKAREDNVSLNQYINYQLSLALGHIETGSRERTLSENRTKYKARKLSDKLKRRDADKER